MIQLTPVPEINTLDVILELLSVVGYLFILIMAFFTRKKNKIFASKGYPVLIIALILGVISSIMDFLTELFWIENNYELYKLVMQVFQISSLFVFAISLLLVFKFTKFMLGEDES